MKQSERQAGKDPGCLAQTLAFAFLVTGVILKEHWLGGSVWRLLGEMAAVLGVGTVLTALMVRRTFREEARREARARRRIARGPGGGLARLAQLCFSKKVSARVFEPILSDMLLEYSQALAKGDRLEARCSLVRNYFAFWRAFALQLPISLAKAVVELWLASKMG